MIFDDDKSYYLQNVTAGYVGNSPLFYAKKGGYTPWLEHAQGLEMHARSYRDILRSSNARLLKYAYEMAVESERVFNDQADRAETSAAQSAEGE